MVIIKQATPADYSGILKLQIANRPEQLNEEEKEQGFVISNFTEEALDAMNEELGILVAVSHGEVVGFLCMTPTEPLPSHPVIRAMLKTFPQQQFNGKSLDHQRVFIYGPVCIDRNQRGKGILKELFAGMKDTVRLRYEVGVAFISDDNPHSLSAHVQGLGMTALAPFVCDGQRFQLVAFPT